MVAHHAPQLPHRDLAVVVGVKQRERLLEAVQLLRSRFEGVFMLVAFVIGDQLAQDPSLRIA